MVVKVISRRLSHLSAFLFRASCDRSVAFSASDTSGFSPVTPESNWAYSYVQQVRIEEEEGCGRLIYCEYNGMTSPVSSPRPLLFRGFRHHCVGLCCCCPDHCKIRSTSSSRCCQGKEYTQWGEMEGRRNVLAYSTPFE